MMSIAKKIYLVLKGNEVSGLKEYFLGHLRKIESRFHSKKIVLLKNYETTIENEILKLSNSDHRLLKDIEEEFSDIHNSLSKYFTLHGTADTTLARLLYCLSRIKKPEYIVETGVWHGVSSTFLLSAIQKNGKGFLHSIDVPPVDPAIKVEIGGAIPLELREHWRLHLGHSRMMLPKVLNEISNLQFFVHDSEHSYRNMYNEYKIAWPKIDTGGFLISDDIALNDAFIVFGKKIGRDPVVIKREKGGYIGYYIK